VISGRYIDCERFENPGEVECLAWECVGDSVALDGTKDKANASEQKAMSCERRGETEKKLEAEMKALLAEAAPVDGEEDGKYGKGKRGDELPEEWARRESRLAKIRELKMIIKSFARVSCCLIWPTRTKPASGKCAARSDASTTSPPRGTGDFHSSTRCRILLRCCALAAAIQRHFKRL
jgi:hypothetical protein